MSSGRLIGVGGVIVLLSACGASVSEAPPPMSEAERRGAAAGSEGSLMDIFGGRQVGNVAIGNPGSDVALAGNVNRFLWQASLDTLAFLPIASTDPFTGVIATDWGAAPDAPGERFKVTAYVTDRRLQAESLRVAVFREVLEGGAWVTAPVAGDTPRRLEDSILVRARQLRIAQAEAGGEAG
jgi:hypothetical protein